MKVEVKKFGLGADLITISNQKGMSVSFTNFGARIVKWLVPTQEGIKNIVWGFESTQEYLEMDAYPGATIGRVAGRIIKGKAYLDGQTFETVQNDGQNTLHGGPASFERRLWLYNIIEEADKVILEFSLISNAGENGFPGQLEVKVRHSFDENGLWIVDYQAQSDADTLFNPTNHVYFNLSGDMTQSIDEHTLLVRADALALLNDETLPLGKKLPLSETSLTLNLNQGEKLSEVFSSGEAQVKLVNGLDHPFFLKEPSLTEAQAELSLGELKVSVFTDRPALVLFTANFDEKTLENYQGKLGFHSGITFEAQVAPGAGEFAGFGNIVLKQGQIFHSQTAYKVENVVK